MLLALLLCCACVDAAIQSSAVADRGAKDSFGRFHEEQIRHGGEAMRNVKYVSNDGVMTSSYPERPAPKKLADYSAAWKLEDSKRTIALIILDMEEGYRGTINFMIPSAQKLLAAFRKAGQPVVWTNWARRAGDGFDGALDRFYGTRGTDNEENPMYVYGPDATETVAELAPETAEEKARTIKSLHLSKFADLDSSGQEILDPMLRGLGVDTVVVVGSWTEDCVLATIYDAVDKLGYDAVLIQDGVATGSPMQLKAIEVMKAAAAKVIDTSMFLEYFSSAAANDLLKPPKTPSARATLVEIEPPARLPASVPGDSALRGDPSVPLPLALVAVALASLVSATLAYRFAVHRADRPPSGTREGIGETLVTQYVAV